VRLTLLALAASCLCGAAQAAADFQSIPITYTLVSADGKSVVGMQGETAFHWTQGGALTSIQSFPTPVFYPNSFELTAISGDGSVALLNLPDEVTGRPQQFWIPALWTKERGVQIVEVPGVYAIAEDISADGRTIVGRRASPAPEVKSQTFRWSADQGLQILQAVANDGEYLWSVDDVAISGDGRVVVGVLTGISNLTGRSTPTRMVFWHEGRRDPLVVAGPAGMAWFGRIDISHDGRRVTGLAEAMQADGSAQYQAFLWDQAEGAKLLGVLPGAIASSPNAISGDGQVVVGRSSGAGASPQQPFRWSAQTGMISVAQWLAAYGIALPANTQLGEALSTNFDGSVIVGHGWIARVRGPSGGVLLDVSGFQRSLIDANQRLTQGISELANATLSGAHHRSLLSNGLVDESDGSCAWANAEVADYDASKTRIEQLEVGVCTDLGPARLGLGLGKAKARQEWDLGSQGKSEGEYLLGEAAFKFGEQWQGSLLGYSGRFDVDSQRRYYNGTALHTSLARPDAKVAALRARMDWKDAARVGGVGISPYAAYTWTRTKLDGYVESGGGFPSSFDRIDWSTRDLRVGAAFERSFGERNDLSVSLEAVRRMDKISSGTRGEIIDLFSFDLPGGELDRNWGQMLVDFDHRFGKGSVLGVGARAASSGGDADWGVSLGYRMSF